MKRHKNSWYVGGDAIRKVLRYIYLFPTNKHHMTTNPQDFEVLNEEKIKR